jgi:hypothetical protein
MYRGKTKLGRELEMEMPQKNLELKKINGVIGETLVMVWSCKKEQKQC